MIKRIIRIALNIISVAAILIAMAAMLTVVFTPSGQSPQFFGYSMLRVLTGSMEPALPSNSLIVVHKIEPNDIEPGDIITFYSADPKLEGALNTHRVTDIDSSSGQYVFTTKGDANAIPDAYTVSEDAVLGIVVLHSAVLGKIVSLLTNPILFVLIIAVPLLVMVIYNLYKVIHSTVKVMQKEEQDAVEQALRELQKQKNEQQKEESQDAESDNK